MTFHLKCTTNKDTAICDFTFKDADGNIATTLFVGTKYTIEAWLCTKAFLGVGGCNSIPFTKGCADGAEVAGGVLKLVKNSTELAHSGNTDSKGLAGSFYWTPTASNAGSYNVKLKFAGITGYNACESNDIAIEVQSKPDRGVIVTVRDVPAEGLTVQVGEYNRFAVWPIPDCWQLFSETKDVTPESTVVTFDLAAYTAEHLCVGVLNSDNVMMDQEKNVTSTPPANVTLEGWLGRPYRSRITTNPHTVKPDEGFAIEAHLFHVFTNEKMGSSREVTFYRYNAADTREEIGTGITDENGVAKRVWQESEVGTYEYEAEYDPGGNRTFPETGTVIVSEAKCPIDISSLETCPILTALQGSMVFPHLDTLRWYRDTKLSPALTKAYYSLIPITGRIARHSRLARLIVRALSTFAIRRIERRWGGEIPYLQPLKQASHEPRPEGRGMRRHVFS